MSHARQHATAEEDPLRWIATDPLAGLRMEDPQDEDDDLDEDEDPDDEQDEDEGDDQDEDESLREAGKKALQRERKARREAERELKRLREENEDDPARAIREAAEAAEQKYHGIIARSAFRAALAEAGLQKGQAKLLKLLDLDAVTVDEDGEVEGVADQVDDLKKEFPELFAAPKKGAGKGDGGGERKKTTKKTETSAERLARQAGF